MTTSAKHWRTPAPPRIAVDEAGRGPTVLFLHGIGGNRGNWAGQLERLAPRYRGLALDFRGYGDSDDIPGDALDFADLVDDALAVLDAAGVDAAHVVGLSMGGLVAQALYARAPGRVQSLVLAACRPGDAPVHPDEAGEAFVAARLKPLEDGKSVADMAAALLPMLVAERASDIAWRRVHESLLALRKDQYAHAVRARMIMAPVLDLARMRVPVLVMGGGADRVAPPGQMRALAEALPGAEYVEFPGTGHLLNIEAEAGFDAALLAFLDAQAAAASVVAGGHAT